MPIHIDKLTSEVNAFQGDMPLSEQQIESLIRRIIEKLEEMDRNRSCIRDATELNDTVISD